MLQAKGEVQKLIVKAQDGALEAQPGRTIMESFEGQVHSFALLPPVMLAQRQDSISGILLALMYSRHQTGCLVLPSK